MHVMEAARQELETLDESPLFAAFQQGGYPLWLAICQWAEKNNITYSQAPRGLTKSLAALRANGTWDRLLGNAYQAEPGQPDNNADDRIGHHASGGPGGMPSAEQDSSESEEDSDAAMWCSTSATQGPQQTARTTVAFESSPSTSWANHPTIRCSRCGKRLNSVRAGWLRSKGGVT